MSTDAPAAADPDHADGHDDHGPADEVLGPIDAPAWLAGALGVVLGLAVTICFVLATLDGPRA